MRGGKRGIKTHVESHDKQARLGDGTRHTRTHPPPRPRQGAENTVGEADLSGTILETPTYSLALIFLFFLVVAFIWELVRPVTAAQQGSQRGATPAMHGTSATHAGRRPPAASSPRGRRAPCLRRQSTFWSASSLSEDSMASWCAGPAAPC